MADTLGLGSLQATAQAEAAGDRTRAAAASDAGASEGGSSRSCHSNTGIAQAAARVAARAAAGLGGPRPGTARAEAACLRSRLCAVAVLARRSRRWLLYAGATTAVRGAGVRV